MGSGSSKKSAQPKTKTAPPRPVANVNKQQQDERGGENDNKFKENDKNLVRREIENNNNNKQVDKEAKANKKESKKMKMEEKRENMLTFEEDSDMENDIDEVLKIPVAVEYPKPKKKDKKEKKNNNTAETVNYDQKLERDLFNSNGFGYDRNEDLPMTYAQRQQRQQYKLQQDLLIRQKTMYRNSRDWDDYEEEEEKENLTSKGFDPSKFRAANQGGDGKKDLFKTSQEELDTPRYLQDGRGMDDFQTNQKPSVLNKELPNYNQSEIDLMQELERDLL